MKKILFLFVALLAATAINAQQIITLNPIKTPPGNGGNPRSPIELPYTQ